MKLLLLSDPASAHIIKWANGLSSKGIQVFIFGLSNYNQNEYNSKINIKIVDFSYSVKKTKDGNYLKSVYLTTLPKLKKYILNIKPDIIHAHSASSFGFLGALSGFHPFFISVWGSDIYTFPRKSIIHKMVMKYTLSKADRIFSTSYTMKTETENYTSKEITVIHFGIDTSVFRPMEVKSMFKEDDIVVGTVKTLDYNYGIEYLIEAFARLVEKYPTMPLKLLLVGGGAMIDSLKEYAAEIGIIEKTIFTGYVPFSDVPLYHNMLDIAIFPSVNESFGVSVLEASACEKPVIASDAGGLPEVVEDNITGLIFPSKNVDKLYARLESLLFDSEFRQKLGKAGRERVVGNYNFSNNVNQMIEIYSKLLK